MEFRAEIENSNYKIEINRLGDSWKTFVDGRPIKLQSLKIEQNRIVSFLLNNKYYRIEIIKNGDSYHCWLGSKLLKTNIIDEKTARFSKLSNGQSASVKSEMLLAPMPGLIVKVEVQPGQIVKKGEGLVIMEAMKMENELRAAHDCTIAEIKIQSGQIVNKAQPLIIFK